jgi:hypothetical protein
MPDKVTKTFRRVVRTGDYETVEVISSMERECSTPEDFDQLRQDATEQLVDDLDTILDKLGLEEKRVKVTSKRPRPAGV